jgi:hypothetical protein
LYSSSIFPLVQHSHTYTHLHPPIRTTHF